MDSMAGADIPKSSFGMGVYLNLSDLNALLLSIYLNSP